MNKGIGITERGDAGLDFAWVDKVQRHPFSIIITKNLSNTFIDKVADIENVIVHATITGYGGTALEPNVPSVAHSLLQLQELSARGFPIERTVVRIDPMIQTEKGAAKAERIIRWCNDNGYHRIRYSYLDLYQHVKERFANAGIPVPKVTKPNFMRDIIPQYPNIRFESCAEGLETDVGCISPYDFELFGVRPDTEEINAQNRRNCQCLACKVELLNYKNNKRCPHKCLYCYWRD